MLILFLSLLWNPADCLPVSDGFQPFPFNGIPDPRGFYNFDNIYGSRILANPLTFRTDEPRDETESTLDSSTTSDIGGSTEPTSNIRDLVDNDGYQSKPDSVSTEDLKHSLENADSQAKLASDPMGDIKDSLDTIILFLHGIRDLLGNKSTNATDSLSPIAAEITVLGQNLLSSLPTNSCLPCDDVIPDAEIIVLVPKPEDAEDVSQTLSTKSDNSQEVNVPKVTEDFILPKILTPESKDFSISKKFFPEPVVSDDFSLSKILAPEPEDRSFSNRNENDTVILMPLDDEENTESPLLHALLNNHQKKVHSHDKKTSSNEKEKPDDDDSDSSLRKKLAKLLWSAVNGI